MLVLAFKLLLAYGLGCCLGSQVLRLIVGGDDVRRGGSRSAGATNALRTRGVWFAAGVLAIDFIKGILAASLIPLIPLAVWLGMPDAPITVAQISMACGVAAAAGHVWPAPFGFAGGKGAATLLGVYTWIVPFGVLLALAAFTLMVLVTGYVGLSTVVSAGVVVLYVVLWEGAGVLSPLGLFSLAMLLLVMWTHRQNLQRLLAGDENQFQSARLIGNRLPPARRKRADAGKNGSDGDD